MKAFSCHTYRKRSVYIHTFLGSQEEETDRASIDTPVVSPKDGATMNDPDEQV